MAKAKQQAAKFVRFKAEIYWANLERLGEQSGKYEFNACNLNDKTVEALENLGLEVKMKEKNPEMGRYVTFRSKRPIPAYDEDGDRLDGSLVGNESEAIITAGAYDWEFKGKKGTSATCKKLVITDLKEYTGGPVNEDEVEETL